jgi:phosphohistidine phosphatase
MDLYLMRHGIAVVRGAPGIRSDRARHLTQKGIKRMEKAAKGLAALKISFDHILTSPLVRARQTAEVLAETLNMAARLKEIPELAPDETVQSLLDSLTPYRRDEHLLLVGHEPLLSETASFLLSKDTQIELLIKKAGICAIEVDGLPPQRPGTLLWMLAPRQLRLLSAQ